jgi:YfiH family protein
VLLGFTGRADDGRDPYGDANLGLHVGDDAGRVRANRERLARRAGVAPDRLFVAAQVHGTHVERVDGGWDDAPEADALVTDRPGTALAVLVADCVPVLLADAAAGVVGVAHAGRRGMTDGVVPAAVGALRDLGARDLSAVVGPSVCARCYEVPAALREEVAAAVPVSASVSRTGTPAVDVAAGVLQQLADLGVAVELVPGCTAERPDLYSHRRDGVTGRFAGVAALGERA